MKNQAETGLTPQQIAKCAQLKIEASGERVLEKAGPHLEQLLDQIKVGGGTFTKASSLSAMTVNDFARSQSQSQIQWKDKGALAGQHFKDPTSGAALDPRSLATALYHLSNLYAGALGENMGNYTMLGMADLYQQVQAAKAAQAAQSPGGFRTAINGFYNNVLKPVFDFFIWLFGGAGGSSASIAPFDPGSAQAGRSSSELTKGSEGAPQASHSSQFNKYLTESDFGVGGFVLTQGMEEAIDNYDDMNEGLCALAKAISSEQMGRDVKAVAAALRQATPQDFNSAEILRTMRIFINDINGQNLDSDFLRTELYRTGHDSSDASINYIGQKLLIQIAEKLSSNTKDRLTAQMGGPIRAKAKVGASILYSRALWNNAQQAKQMKAQLERLNSNLDKEYYSSAGAKGGPSQGRPYKS